MYHSHNLGKRRGVLATAAVLAAVRAAAYTPPMGQRIPDPLRIASAGQPWMFALFIGAWVAIAGYCLYHLRSGHLLRPVSIFCGMYMAWGLAWLIPWMLADFGTAWWINGVTFLGLGVIVVLLVLLTPAFPAPEVHGD